MLFVTVQYVENNLIMPTFACCNLYKGMNNANLNDSFRSIMTNYS